MNPLLLIDGYKLDHRRQYPPGTTRVYSNWTPRKSRIPGQNSVVFFGLQFLLQGYLEDSFNEDFFGVSRGHVLDEYRTFINKYLGPNHGITLDHIEALHKLRYLPLEIHAVPEGTLVPLRQPALTIQNTHPDHAWLVNYLETLLSSVLWMPCTSATTAYRLRKLLNEACKKTGGDPSFVPWQGHDFSFRGMPGVGAAQYSGAAHLLSFTGTDTIPAIEAIEGYYSAHHGTLSPIGGSVAATEHSVMSAGGHESELETYSRLLDLYPTGVLSVVSDTWNLWNVLTKILPALKDKILARKGKLVIRPDSGDPVEIVCGTNYTQSTSPRDRGVIELLWEVFGGTKTATHHLLLDPHIGCIYGDAITYDRAKQICDRLAMKGFASTNMVFGVGSYTYQYVTRDTFGFAMKATEAVIDGKPTPLFKKPATDDGEKNSARGRLAVINGQLIEDATPAQEAQSDLQLVWRDGISHRHQSFDEVKEVLWSPQNQERNPSVQAQTQG